MYEMVKTGQENKMAEAREKSAKRRRLSRHERLTKVHPKIDMESTQLIFYLFLTKFSDSMHGKTMVAHVYAR